MPKRPDDTPENLRPYLFHGVHLEWSSGDKEAVADCPFCGRESKFSVNIATAMWRCLVCNEGNENGNAIKGGNQYVFIRKLFDTSYNIDQNYGDLAEERGISPEYLHQWGVCKSITTGDWIIPGYGIDGKQNQLYRYMQGDGRWRWLPTPGMGHQIVEPWWDEKANEVYIQEGFWDGMALDEVMSQCKETEEGTLRLTNNPNTSIRARANIIALASCTAFNEAWLPLFSGKVVYLGFDNDHPRKHPTTGADIPPGGITGMMRVASLMAGYKNPPAAIYFLKWGEEGEGYSLELPHGYDVRDALKPTERGLASRIEALERLRASYVHIPDTWIIGDKSSKTGNSGLGGENKVVEQLPCESYKELTQAWRKAMKWTPGLDHGLSTMLACIVSTMAVGDQLWGKFIGPASCLSGDTPIYDPVMRDVKTVRERYELGESFNVWSKFDDDSLGIVTALPPERHPEEQMYEVTFESGKTMKVTGGHRYWNGSSYINVQTLLEQLEESSVYPLPTISDIVPLAQRQDALHSSQTVEDYQSSCCVYSCPCGEQLPEELNNVPDVAPLHNDAQEYARQRSCKDGLLVHGYRRTQRLSSLDSNRVPYLVWLLRCVVECGYLSVSNIYDKFQLKSLVFWQILQRIFPWNTLQPICQFAPHSNDTHSQHLVPEGSYKHELAQHEDVLQSRLETDLLHRVLNTGLFSQQTIRELWQDASPHQLLSSNGRRLLGQHVVPDKPQQEFFQTGTIQQQVEHDQSIYFSITRGHKTLDRLTLTEVDRIVKILPCGKEPYYDFHVPETNNYWAQGVINHNCGKSTLCEAVSANSEYVVAKSTIRGFHSGYGDGGEDQDHSLISQIKGKTLVTKDGDTIIQSPNLSQILSEARDIYDTVSRSSYRNKSSRNYSGIRMTWLLCGTSSLRALDSSELGERFLDCVIMDEIDDELEDDILMRVASRAARHVAIKADDKPETHQDPSMTLAMQLTSGYVQYLRDNDQALLDSVKISDECLRKCSRLGKFVAFMRARPSTRQAEKAEREFAARLVSQHTRLAMCLSAVFNKTEVDDNVMARTRQIALDTARGLTLDMVKYIVAMGDDGAEHKALALYMNKPDEEVRRLLRFLKAIHVLEVFVKKSKSTGITSKPRWRLTNKFEALYTEVMGAETIVEEEEDDSEDPGEPVEEMSDEEVPF